MLVQMSIYNKGALAQLWRMPKRMIGAASESPVRLLYWPLRLHMSFAQLRYIYLIYVIASIV